MQEQEKNTFTMTHISMALKYGGISFIAGSVSHGVFSGQRSILTALLGLFAFILGTWLESRHSHSQQVKSELLKTLAISSVLGISLGFFTGSLQHFPDSPFRSVWTVPLGFLLSLIALALSQNKPITATVKRYAISSFAVVLVSSIAAYSYFSQNPLAGGHDHGAATTASTEAHDDHTQHGNNTTAKNTSTDENHDHGSHQTSPLIGEPGKATDVQRIIEVNMTDNMRFLPNQIEVKAGETLRVIAKNSGKIRHELTLGSPMDLQQHAEMMLKMPDMAHEEPNMVQVDPGKTGEIIWTFKQSGVVDFACLQPGHYEAGMRGMVTVNN